MQTICPACNSDVWADVVTGSGTDALAAGFVYRCPVSECLHIIGPYRRDGVDVSVRVSAQVASRPSSVASPPSASQVPAADPIEQMRARMRAIDSQLASIAALKVERAYLARILRAAEPRPRKATP